MATTEKKQTTRAAGTRASKATGSVKPAAKTAARTAKAKAAPAAREEAPVKSGPAVNLVFQYMGREISQAGMVEAVMNAWTSQGGDPDQVTSLDLYVKPEDATVYYVINGTEQGTFAF